MSRQVRRTREIRLNLSEELVLCSFGYVARATIEVYYLFLATILFSESRGFLDPKSSGKKINNTVGYFFFCTMNGSRCVPMP